MLSLGGARHGCEHGARPALLTGLRRGSVVLQESNQSLVREMALAKSEVVGLSERLLLQLQATDQRTSAMQHGISTLEQQLQAETAELGRQLAAEQEGRRQLENQYGGALLVAQQLEAELVRTRSELQASHGR